MDQILLDVNRAAVIAGTIVSYGLGFLWFGPVFGKTWAAGSHGITPPDRPPLVAAALQLIGTFLMAWVIGATATINALVTAILLILAIAALLTAGSLFSRTSATAALLDGGFIVVMGLVMIVLQGVL
ncbi:MAG: DUF1761 domain-containing protein [Rhodobacter sp.]|nr:DUF1761 domain-containing protein [Rhodobacter sp.]